MKSFLLQPVLAVAIMLPLSAQQSNTPAPDTAAPGAQNTQPATDPRDGNTTSINQENNTQNTDNPDAQPRYRVTVVERSTQAVDYRDRSGTTQVDFKGTPLMPRVTGDAKVTGHTGRMAIDASLHHLEPARTFGPQYLTYVLWAITTEGRAVNLGEVVPSDGNARVQLTSGLQEFGMVVTAEPYFAVTRPSDLVVAENIIRSDTKGGIHPISARYQLLQRGQYTINLTPDKLPATAADKKTPLQLLEAENAIAIAEASGAEQYAPAPLEKARENLNQARDYERRKQGSKVIATVARAAAQNAEDARLTTLEKKRQQQLAEERRAAQERIQTAQSQAQAESARAEEAHREAQHEAEQRSLADQQRQVAEQAAQQAAEARTQAQQQLQEAEAARQAAQQQQQALSQQAEQARLQAQQAEQARMQAEQQAEQTRQRLLNQLNQVLQTRDSARGLIVNMSDVLFDTGRATLKPGAKLRLAKVAGIILAYPDLKLEIDGFTDSTGSSTFNQELSERRALAVSDFLVSQGVTANNVITHGYGPSNPVASNTTVAGRQLNRRVELVVSGNAIASTTNGTPTPVTTPQSGTPPPATRPPML
jgi:outer membrane protein OmpA-like peptidoglycan-associated protein